MLIVPTYSRVDGHKTHHMPPIPAREITKRLGFFPIIDPTPDGKTTREWRGEAEGQPFAIWDYRGLEWSAYDPFEVLPRIFGFTYRSAA